MPPGGVIMFDLRAVNDVILTLYRDGRDIALRSYQDWALEQVRGLIPFDSAWWGNAAAEPMKIHWIHLFNCDDSIMELYPPYMAQDFFRAALMANPGNAVNMADLTTREKFVNTALYQNCGKRYHIEWSLGTLLVDPASSLHEFLTLWRHDGDKPFNSDERETKELLMPHLAEAFRAVRLRHFLRGIDTRGKAWALADDHGYIREASPSFIACLRDHWPKWKSNRLPDTLAQSVTEGFTFESKALAIDLKQSENLRFLQVRPKNALDKLTVRESEIVSRYANGETYSAIAKAVKLAPATVRNHISHSFRKLSVRNKAELATLLARGK
jgi:DNA-binding CsgD family transcriptional regulator